MVLKDHCGAACISMQKTAHQCDKQLRDCKQSPQPDYCNRTWVIELPAQQMRKLHNCLPISQLLQMKVKEKKKKKSNVGSSLIIKSLKRQLDLNRSMEMDQTLAAKIYMY